MKTLIFNIYTKKSIQTIAVIFVLQVNFLFAAEVGGDNYISNSPACKTCAYDALTLSLAPVTPSEATFADDAAITGINLAPVTPGEATFEEVAEVAGITLSGFLAPVPPAEASFEDGPESVNSIDLVHFAPATPAEADFND